MIYLCIIMVQIIHFVAKELLNFEGLFGEDENPFKQLSVHHEPLLRRSSLYDFEIQEHLHTNLVQVFFITSGGGYLLNTGRKIHLESPCVLIVPSNTLHGFALQSEVKGDVFTIQENVFENFIKNGEAYFSSFDQLQLLSFELEDPTFWDLVRLKNQMIKELENPDPSASIALPLLFQLFLLQLYRSQSSTHEQSLEVDNRTLRHFRKFKKLLKEYIPEEHSVKFYAEAMNISSVHLNRICQSVQNQSALRLIHEQIHFEARKFLSGSSYSVAEIAYLLGFKDPPHFSKFFKKLEGITALTFRKNLEES